MKMFVVFVILLHVSQHALTVLVEVHQGEESVLLPCQYSGSIPEDDPTVMWTRNDLDQTSVHLRREEGDDLKGQNQHYRSRTSMNPDPLDTGDFSLTLRKPQLIDSGIYTCSISDDRNDLKVTDVHLKIKDQQVEVKVDEGLESVILPCKTKPGLPEDTTVEWSRSDLGLITVLEYSNRNDDLKKQDDRYCGRTKMNEDLLRTGDLSLTLKYPTERDSGRYICTIYRDKDILRQKVVLRVKEQFTSWPAVLIILLVLLVVSGGLIFGFRQYFMSDYKVMLDSGEEYVQLPCKALIHLPHGAKVEWKNAVGRLVHMYENGSDKLEKQDEAYRNRTKMKKNLLKLGDFSLTLNYPTDRDTNTYICTIYNKEGKIKEKKVLLYVRVPEVVEVDSGVESVQLICKTTVNLPEDAKVEWTSIHNQTIKVHLYPNDQLKEQHQIYRERTKMNEDSLKTGDLSLTLKHPTDWDAKPHTCTVYSRDGETLMKKQVELRVKVCQVKVGEEAKSVELPFKTTENLPEDAKVEWWDNSDRKVHVYENRSDQPQDQDPFYRNRTKMNEDLLKTGDLSLTLKYPTEEDHREYRCKVYSNIHRYKKVVLKVNVCQLEVDQGAESVQLPFKTTENLPEDAKVQWKVSGDKMVHVYKNGSDQPAEQLQVYRDRTKMNEDLLKTGDLSLTLKHPTVRDSGKYSCRVFGDIQRYKTVVLKVKVCQVEMEKGADSVQLPFKTTENLPEDTKVEWWDSSDRKVHVYKDSSDQPQDQDPFYRNRTKMNEDLLKTGDLSLTLKHPTERDSGEYRCKVFGDIQRYKTVVLKVNGSIRNRSSSNLFTPLLITDGS
ncbi:unnamed protein product [Oreochromis niloticus]|nr:unnamed protein product [Mustela putorius furo]